MKTKHFLYTLVFASIFLCLPQVTKAQVRMGGEADPTDGTVLDLNNSSSGYIGGLLLPHIEIKDLRYIPVTFTDAENMTGYSTTVLPGTSIPSGVDTNTDLTGMLVYNSVAITNIPTGIYVWRGTDWQNLYYPEINGGGHLPDFDASTGTGYKFADFDGDGECGAYITNGRWLRFMCHNLGADTSLDPFNPTQQDAAKLHGAKYRFGAKEVSMTMAEDQGTPPANWSSLPYQANGDWNDENDPCPDGWRMPVYSTEWTPVISTRNNKIKNFNGTPWTSGSYTTGLTIGKRLFLPATGRRDASAMLHNRGRHGYYWSSEGNGSNGDGFYFDGVTPSAGIATYARTHGYAVRCVTVDKPETNPAYDTTLKTK